MWASAAETEEAGPQFRGGGKTGGRASGNPLQGRMTLPPSAQIAGIYRYPVKGLSPEPLDRAALTPGETLLSDRRYAIENGPSGFDPAEPKWLSKPHFLMLQRDEWLAPLRTHFDDASHTLTIRQDGAVAAEGDLETTAGRTAIEQFFANRYAGEIKGPPRILTSPGHSFSDVARKVVSIINLASLRAIETLVDHPVHPLRFRANLYVEGWPAWHEFEQFDRTLVIGDTRLKVVKRIVRCAAVNVDPDTGARDLSIPNTLMRRLGHNDCGIYAEVIEGGRVGVGEAVAVEQPALL
jgi:MOSC domain-containing protein